MKLWKTRHHSLEVLSKQFKDQSNAIDDAFQAIDECIDLFEKKFSEDKYFLVCGLTLLKAKNLAVGMYSLTLDGLAQEAGALARPFIEYHELLIYFRLDPKRINEALEEKLPTAGKRAQLIKGRFKEFRDHLNNHASHSAFSNHSLLHLFDSDEKRIKKQQKMSPNVLFRNIGNLHAHLILLLQEAILCFGSKASIQLIQKIDQLRVNCIPLFKLDERS